MTQQQECIFCKIALKKIPTNIIIENDKTMAFLDAYPLAKGHVLVIPKDHYSKIQELDENSSQSLFNVLWKITNPIEKAMGVNSSTIAIHNGREAGQDAKRLCRRNAPYDPDPGVAPGRGVGAQSGLRGDGGPARASTALRPSCRPGS